VLFLPVFEDLYVSKEVASRNSANLEHPGFTFKLDKVKEEKSISKFIKIM